MIFIVRKRALGDVIWVEPFLSYLADKHKGRRIFIYTKYPQVFENYPYPRLTVQDNPKWYVKAIIRILAKLKAPNCFVLDETYEDDAQKHFLKAYYDKFNIVNGYLRYPSLDYILDSAVVKKRMFVFHIANNNVLSLYRKVYGIDWKSIFEYVISLGYEIMIINKPEEIGIKAGQLPVKFFSGSFRELVNTINSAAYFVGLDSAPSHIAASLKVPAILFFGSVKVEYRHFVEQFNGFFLQGYCEKAGCYHVQEKNKQVCLINEDQTVVPKCTIHSNEELITTINKLIDTYEI